jgi:hypothetical protein
MVLQFGQHSYYTLQGVAPRMWGLLARGTSPRVIIAQLRREIGAPVERIEAEVAAVLARLLEAGLINRQPR